MAAAAALPSPFQTDITCGYCHVFLQYMEDPRELSCGHVHCFPCIERPCPNNLLDEDYDAEGRAVVVICPEEGCNKRYENIDIDNLKVVNPEDAGLLTCDHALCEDKPAVNFCIDCGKKLCLTHLEMHASFFHKEHKVVDIHVYEEAPRKHKKVYCPQHSKEVMVKGCSNCSKLACSECDRSEGVCTGQDGSPHVKHVYEQLEKFAEEISCEIKKKLRSVEDKIGEVKDMDKEAWRRLAVLQVECKECVEEIEKYRQQQIELINNTCVQMKKNVEGHVKEIADRVEMFSTHVVDKKEKIQDVYRRVKNIINNGHKVDKVTHRHNMANELDRCIDEYVGTCVLTDKVPTLTITSGHSLAELNLVKIPLSLHFSSQHDTAGSCYSVTGRDNGDLLLGCEDGLQLMNKSTGEITSVDLPFKQVHSVVVLHHAIYILHLVDQTVKVEMCLPNLQHHQTLFEFHKEGKKAPSMSVSDRHLVVYYAQDPSSGDFSRHLIIYDFTTAQPKYIQVNTIHLPHFLPNGHLLVAGGKNIRKVKIEDSQLVTIWSCDGLKKVHGVVSDEQGIIYACTWGDTKLLYIISPNGEILRQIKDDRIPSVGGKLYVKDDMLYLPGWFDCKLHIFKFIKQ